jgi:hypothetical protein
MYAPPSWAVGFVLVLTAALIVLTVMQHWSHAETVTLASNTRTAARSRTIEPFSNFYYNNSYVTNKLEESACKQAVVLERFANVDDCLSNQAQGWQWIKYNKKAGLQCVSKLRVRPNYNLNECGQWRGGALDRNGDDNYPCNEQLCSFSTVAQWTTTASGGALPAVCITKTTKASCETAVCDWVANISDPAVYSKCLDDSCACIQHVGKKYTAVYNTQCCNGKQCLCQCADDTSKMCSCKPQVNACSWGWSASARAGAPACWNLRTWAARRVQKGGSNGIIAGCGFPNRQLRLGKDWLRRVAHTDNDDGAAANVVNNSS